MIDLQKMQRDLESIICYSQDYPFSLNAKNLIDEWYTQKRKLIDTLFNGKGIIRSSHPIKIYLSEKQKQSRFNEFINILDEQKVLTTEFESFLRDNEKGFFDNRVLLPYPSFNIPLGSKLSKSFKKFIDDSDTVRLAQDTASRFIQENKIEGYLYLSIYPLDFLTISENNEEWSSCHSLDGDYRTGNLSYMVDQTTIVAYLADDKMEHLRCLPAGMTWNSKKWRMLIHTDGIHNIYYDRQYPYESEALLDEVHKMVNALVNETMCLPINYGFNAIQNSQGRIELLTYNQLCAGGRIFDTRDIIDAKDYLGYSDLLLSKSYTPIISLNRDLFFNYVENRHYSKEREDDAFYKAFKIKVGEQVVCPCCGEEFIKRTDSFLCENCIAENDADEDFYLKCDSCGHRIYEEDEIFWMDDRPYCKKCHTEIEREDLVTLEED